MARSRAPKPLLDLVNARFAERDEADETEQLARAAEATFHLMDRAIMVPRERLRGMPDQPRQAVHDDAALRELARSIAANGILEPVLASRDPDNPGYYILIAGHRRVAAADLVAQGDVEVPLPDDDKLKGAARARAQADQRAAAKDRVETIPTIVLDVDRPTAFALALVENLQRSDLSRREVMDAVKRLKDEFHWSIRKIARETGRDDGDLSILIRIAEDPDVAPLVADELISATAAGPLIERAHYRVRGPVLAAIRTGRLRTTSEIERALAAERDRLAPPPQPAATDPRTTGRGSYGQVPDIQHLTITEGEDTASMGGESASRQMAPTGSLSGEGQLAEPPHRAGQATATGREGTAETTRTVEVAAHTRRIRGGEASGLVDEATVEGLVRDVITALPRGVTLTPATVHKVQELIDHLATVVREQTALRRG